MSRQTLPGYFLRLIDFEKSHPLLRKLTTAVQRSKLVSWEREQFQVQASLFCEKRFCGHCFRGPRYCYSLKHQLQRRDLALTDEPLLE